jgi:hypothetical protein
LRSFLGALHNGGFERGDVTFLNDGPGMPGHRLAVMESAGDVIATPGLGNGGSYRFALSILGASLWADDDLVYLVEDDYFHRPNALTELARAADSIRDVPYFTLYDYPGFYEPTAHIVRTADRRAQASFTARHGAQSWKVGSTEWRAVRSTTMTYGARVGALKRDLWIHELGASLETPRDGQIWDMTRSQIRQGLILSYFLYANNRSTASRMTKMALHRFRQHVRNRKSEGGLLVAPRPSLSTHLHLPFLAPNVDWHAEAELLRT